jgi:hypothetical protein
MEWNSSARETNLSTIMDSNHDRGWESWLLIVLKELSIPLTDDRLLAILTAGFGCIVTMHK